MVNSRNNRNSEISNSRGRQREDVRFPTAPIKATLPQDYANTLGAIKRRIQETRLRVVLSGNSEMVMLYWDVGRIIIDRQEQSGWGARVIDRLSADLREAFPDTKGFSPRNLKYMRTFSSAWPKRKFVQEALAQIPWYHHIALLEKLNRPAERLWYAREAVKNGWHTIFWFCKSKITSKNAMARVAIAVLTRGSICVSLSAGTQTELIGGNGTRLRIRTSCASKQ